MRIAFIAGTLGPGGAEKQLFYMVRTLRNLGVHIRVYSRFVCPPYDSLIQSLGVEVIPIRSYRGRAHDLLLLIKEMRRFMPHLVQSAHFFCNPYAFVAAKACRSIDIGAIRSDGRRDVETSGPAARIWLHCNRALICNSYAARDNLATLGRSVKNVFVLPNVIDMVSHDNASLTRDISSRIDNTFKVIAVGGMHFPVKRFDIFLRGIALARKKMPNIEGYLAGDGVLRPSLELLASELGISDAVRFLGHRDDIAAILRLMDAHVLTSDQEGFPNVILEAMASSLTVVTTPAGDANRLVEDGQTGFIIPFNSPEALADRLIRLSRNSTICKQYGRLGRLKVESQYSHTQLAARLGIIYRNLAPQYTRPIFESTYLG
jgi:glycosyltransferase involved in cell wall biosynthesis